MHVSVFKKIFIIHMKVKKDGIALLKITDNSYQV